MDAKEMFGRNTIAKDMVVENMGPQGMATEDMAAGDVVVEGCEGMAALGGAARVAPCHPGWEQCWDFLYVTLQGPL
jgi:hypothetical protein